jgi:hypothetical protein
MKQRIKAIPLSRRSFMVTAGGFSAAVAFGGTTSKALAQAMKAGAPFKPNAWVTIGADNMITIVSAAAEMGQGTKTAMPALIANDMDADWAKVKVVQAPADAKNYGNRLFGGACFGQRPLTCTWLGPQTQAVPSYPGNGLGSAQRRLKPSLAQQVPKCLRW